MDVEELRASFDAALNPIFACFTDKLDVTPYLHSSCKKSEIIVGKNLKVVILRALW